MTQPDKTIREEWEKKFDKLELKDELGLKIKVKVENLLNRTCREILKDFIHQEKQKSFEEGKSQIVEQILGMKCMKEEGGNVAGLKDYDKDSYREPWEITRNQLRLQIKEEIQKLLNKLTQ